MTKQLSRSLEDYLEAILMVCNDKGVARVKDIASKLGVRAASVTEALHNLASLGLVNYEPYSVITLTDVGRKQARDILRRHRILTEFLEEVLGVPAPSAENTACLMEHIVLDDTFERFERMVKVTRNLNPSTSLLESLEEKTQ